MSTPNSRGRNNTTTTPASRSKSKEPAKPSSGSKRNPKSSAYGGGTNKGTPSSSAYPTRSPGSGPRSGSRPPSSRKNNTSGVNNHAAPSPTPVPNAPPVPFTPATPSVSSTLRTGNSNSIGRYTSPATIAIYSSPTRDLNPTFNSTTYDDPNIAFNEDGEVAGGEIVEFKETIYSDHPDYRSPEMLRNRPEEYQLPGDTPKMLYYPIGSRVGIDVSDGRNAQIREYINPITQETQLVESFEELPYDHWILGAGQWQCLGTVALPSNLPVQTITAPPDAITFTDTAVIVNETVDARDFQPLASMGSMASMGSNPIAVTDSGAIITTGSAHSSFIDGNSPNVTVTSHHLSNSPHSTFITAPVVPDTITYTPVNPISYSPSHATITQDALTGSYSPNHWVTQDGLAQYATGSGYGYNLDTSGISLTGQYMSSPVGSPMGSQVMNNIIPTISTSQLTNVDPYGMPAGLYAGGSFYQ